MPHGTAKTEQTEQPPNCLSVNINNGMYTLAKKSGQEKAKLITDKKVNYPIRREICFGGQGSLRSTVLRTNTPWEEGTVGKCWKQYGRYQGTTGVETTSSPAKETQATEGMKWRVTGVFCSSRRNKKRRLYEFSCHFSEVTIEQFLFCKLAQNNFLKGGAWTVWVCY